MKNHANISRNTSRAATQGWPLDIQIQRDESGRERVRARVRVAEGVGKGGQTSKNKSGDLKGFFSPILEKLP